MKKILIPVDFSDASSIAVESSIGLAAKMSAQLVLLHVVDEPKDSDLHGEQLDHLLRLPGLDQVAYQYKQILGDTIDTILDEPADLMVVGSRGATGLKAMFVGTHAEKIAKMAECPVIVVKKKTNLADVPSILFPTNMNREDDSIIPALKALQLFYDAKLHILKVFDDALVTTGAVEQRLKDFAGFHHFKKFTVRARPGINEPEEILKEAEELGVKMIAMATHDHKGLGRLLGGYISGRVINSSHIAIWAMSLGEA